MEKRLPQDKKLGPRGEYDLTPTKAARVVVRTYTEALKHDAYERVVDVSVLQQIAENTEVSNRTRAQAAAMLLKGRIDLAKGLNEAAKQEREASPPQTVNIDARSVNVTNGSQEKPFDLKAWLGEFRDAGEEYLGNGSSNGAE